MSDLLSHVVFSALSCSAAIALLLAVRTSVARHFGAIVAYASWALVPLASLAVLLPARSVVVFIHAMPTSPAMVAASPRASAAVPLPPDAGFDASSVLTCLWIAGAVATWLLFAWQQQRFVRSLGRLDALGAGLYRAQATSGCPVLVGMWRPRIVVPTDFETRYTAAQRDLILAHERHHRARGDAPANALATLLRSVFWFNPLVHLAAPCFLADQELACDAAIVARFPTARSAYADALMKTQLGGEHAALACHWRPRNVLLERMTALALPSIARSRRRFGTVTAAVTVLLASIAAWAAQPVQTEVRYAQIAASEPATPLAAGGENAEHPSAPAAPESAPPRVLQRRLESVPQGLTAGADPARRKSQPMPAQKREPAAATTLRVADDRASTLPAPAAVRQSDDLGSNASSADADAPPRQIESFRREHPPAYPAAAVRTHLEGSVVLDVHVDANGRPVDARVAQLEPATANELASASLAAVTHWRFEPAQRGGRAVDGHLDVPFTFALDGQAGYAAPETHRQASYRRVGTAGAASDEATPDAVVYVRVRIEEDGSASASSIDRVDPPSASGLGGAALAALKTWTFNPARDRGKAVASTAIVPVVFGANPQATPPIARIRNLLDPVRVTPTRY